MSTINVDGVTYSRSDVREMRAGNDALTKRYICVAGQRDAALARVAVLMAMKDEIDLVVHNLEVDDPIITRHDNMRILRRALVVFDEGSQKESEETP